MDRESRGVNVWQSSNVIPSLFSIFDLLKDKNKNFEYISTLKDDQLDVNDIESLILI